MATKLDAVLAVVAFARSKGYAEPVTEFRFAPPRRWRFDVCWPERRLAVEVEGAVHAGGRHTRGPGYEADCEKYNEALLRGWRVVRASTGQVRSGLAFGWIERAYEGSQPCPSPSPPPPSQTG